MKSVVAINPGKERERENNKMLLQNCNIMKDSLCGV